MKQGWVARMGCMYVSSPRIRLRTVYHVSTDPSHASPCLLIGSHIDIAEGGRAVAFLWGRIKKKWQGISLPIMRF